MRRLEPHHCFVLKAQNPEHLRNACLSSFAALLNPKPCCRFLKLAPHNVRYETLNQHLAQAGISVGKHSLWDIPLIMAAGSSGHSTSGGGAGPNSSCGGSSRGGSSAGGSSMPGIEPSGGAAGVLQPRQRPGASSPSSPHTHGGSGSAERRGGAATPKPVLLLPPEEFFPFVVPFRCVGDAGGAWSLADVDRINSSANMWATWPQAAGVALGM
jgi:hypothetical protein